MARAAVITREHQVEIDYYLGNAHAVALWLRLLYALLMDTGLRISEVICLPFGVFWSEGKIVRVLHIDGRIRKGKEALDCDATLSESTRQLLQEYANAMAALGLFGPDKMIFPGKRGAGHMSKATASRHLRRMFLTVFAGVDHGYKAHSPRRTKATDMYRSGAKIEEIQKVLGHKCAETTRRYIDVDPRHIQEAEKKVYRERVAFAAAYHVNAAWRGIHAIAVQRTLFSNSVGRQPGDVSMSGDNYEVGIERAVEIRRAEKIQLQVYRFNSRLPKAKPKPVRRKPPDWVSTTD